MQKIKNVLNKKGGNPPPPPAVAAENLPVMAKDVELPPAETDPVKVELLNFFLSAAACTEKEDKEASHKDIKLLTSQEIIDVVKKYVENVDFMTDRTGNLPMTQMFVMTYGNGLPLYAQNASVQQHTVHAMHVIFHELRHGQRHSEALKRKVMSRLSDAFRACQAEQGRVIDSVYGALIGRDKTFREQVLAVVDVQKELVLENVVNKLNPSAWKQGDDIPQKQVPHITSSYRIAIGHELGLRGVAAAHLDNCRFALQPAQVTQVKETFRRMFLVDELCDTLVNDVNQQGKDADRLVNRDDLGRWAGNAEENNGFASHSIYFDEDNVDQYKDLGKPTEENMYQPFLNRKVALEVLKALFLDSDQATKKMKK